MSTHDNEAVLRGHGPRPVTCDHECAMVQLGMRDGMWCHRCGAFHIDGEWKSPTLLGAAIRDRDTMHTTLTIAQDRGTKLVEENRALKGTIDVAGFRVSNDLLGHPTLWCVECGRDGGYHLDVCSKAAR